MTVAELEPTDSNLSATMDTVPDITLHVFYGSAEITSHHVAPPFAHQ